jgi:hypothetical protein
MNRIIFKSRVGSDGVLHLSLPVESADDSRDVQITVEPVDAPALTHDEWRQRILETAGQWQGEFERPPQGNYEQRESLS